MGTRVAEGVKVVLGGCCVTNSGANRKVPGRKGMTYVEEDWVVRTRQPIVGRMTE